MSLGKFTLREIKSRPGRAILTLLSVVIGVAAVVSVSVATSTTRKAFNDMFATLNGRTSLEVMSEAGASFDQSVEEEIAKVPGVKAAVPVIHQSAIMYYDDPKKVGHSQKATVSLLGIDPEKDQAVRDFELVDGQQIDSTKNVLLVDNNFANSLGLKVNDGVRLLTKGGRKKFKIAGLVTPKGVAAISQGVIYMSLETAQRMLRGPDQIDGVQIVYHDDVEPPQMEAAIKAILPPGLVTIAPAGNKSQADETLMGTELVLKMATVFSWVLAAMIVFNTFQMNVAERRRQLAILRAIGATKGQVMKVICREGICMGLLGTLLGILIGFGGAQLLIRAMAQVLQMPLPPMQISGWPVALAVIVGPGISLFGAFVPAWQAGRLSPLEGMGAVLASDMEAPSVWIAVAGIANLLAGGAFLAACMMHLVPVNLSVIAALIMLAGLVLLVPISLGPLTRLVSWVMSPVLRVEGRLAVGQIVRRRGRTTLTVGVLFLALAFGIGMASTIVDNINDVKKWARNAIQGDFIVRAMMPDMNTGLACDLPEAVDKKIRDIKGIANVQTIRFAKSQVLGQGVIIVAGDFASEEGRQFDLETGDPKLVHDAMLKGDVLIGTVFALRAHLKAGDEIPLETLQGPKTVRVVGTVNDYMAGGLTMYMEKHVARRTLGIGGVDAYIIRAARGKLDDVGDSLKNLSEEYGLLWQTQRDLLEIIDAKIYGLVGCLWFLLVLVFVVSALGVVNTLTMNVIEQTRELGLLRIVAMTRRQVRKTILSQAAILAVIGLAPGMLAGLAIAYLMNISTQPVSGHAIAFAIHGKLLAASFAGAFAIILVAAWFPAARAARLKLTDALQYQ